MSLRRPGENAGFLGDQHLPATSEALDPRGFVDVGAAQVGPLCHLIAVDDRPTGMQANPHGNRMIAGLDRRFRKSPLDRRRALHRRAGVSEGDEEGIADRLQLAPVVLRKAAAH